MNQLDLFTDAKREVVQIDTSINLACVGCDGEWLGLEAIPDGWVNVRVDEDDSLLAWWNMMGWCPECQAREGMRCD